MVLQGFHLHHTGFFITNYGNSIKDFDPSRCVDLRLGATHSRLSVLWESCAKAQGFVYSPTRMANWKRPDGSAFNPDESGLPTAGKDKYDSPVLVTAIPSAIIHSFYFKWVEDAKLWAPVLAPPDRRCRSNHLHWTPCSPN